MTHYEVIKSASKEGVAALLASLVAGALGGDVSPDEMKTIYAEMLALLESEAGA